MGYTTDFEGEFKLNKTLADAHREYLHKFAGTRRMIRDPQIATKLEDPVRNAVGLPIGADGAYFVGGLGFRGQENDTSVNDYNIPPIGQPGLWCRWVPNEDGDAIVWDLGEKFYDYVQWLEYIITHFLKPWGYTLDGVVTWQGEEKHDIGKIEVCNNVVMIYPGRITFEPEKPLKVEVEISHNDVTRLQTAMRQACKILLDAEEEKTPNTKIINDAWVVLRKALDKSLDK